MQEAELHAAVKQTCSKPARIQAAWMALPHLRQLADACSSQNQRAAARTNQAAAPTSKNKRHRINQQNQSADTKHESLAARNQSSEPTSRRTSSTSSGLISLACIEEGGCRRGAVRTFSTGMRGQHRRQTAGRATEHAAACRGSPPHCATLQLSPWRWTCRRTSARSFCPAPGAPHQRRPCLGH